jgi:quercetin dioxygenase-like cupin family protein
MVSTVVEPFKVFEVHPQLLESGKTSTRLVSTEMISAAVQVVASGGETNLHNHPNDDAIWFVLNGRATFYTEGNREVATLSKFEALLIPKGTPYWFLCASEAEGENLVIMRFGAKAPKAELKRVDLSERTFAMTGEGDRAQRPTQVKEGAFFGV